jgi:adenosylmethionine-8-amino-7-oxononanoate aminotransferase
MTEEAKGEELTEDYEILREWELKHHFAPTGSRASRSAPDAMTFFIKEEGCRVTDIHGRTFIDTYGSDMYQNVGYGRKEIADAVYSQMLKLSCHVSYNPNVPQVKLAKKLSDITPGDLSVVFFGNSGSDANESGLKMARLYQRLSGFSNRYKIIARKRSYHGVTLGLMSITKPLDWRNPLLTRSYADYEPFMPGVTHIATPYCYRCEFGMTYPACDLCCARQLEQMIQLEVPESVASFIATPVSACSLCNVPPPEYWPIIRAICDKYGVLLHVDEVVTGFGRTGKMFAIEHWNVVPDIMSIAKGLTSGYAPLSATIVTEAIADRIDKEAGTVQHIYTWSGHAPSCAAALANIEIIEREWLVENSASVGEYFLEQLHYLSKHPIIGDVRGIGLFSAIEYVKDKKTKEPLDRDTTVNMSKRFMEEGLITRTRDSSTSFFTPLACTKDDMDEIVAILEKVITETEKKLGI